MSQNGPHPGPAWSADGSDEPYTEPADPWSNAGAAPVSAGAAWGVHPASMPPAADSSTGYSAPHFPVHPTPPPWGQPVVPAARRRNTPIVALVVVLGLLICGGLGTTGWLLTRPDPPAAQPAPTVAPTAANTGSVAAAPSASTDARFVTSGQCVRNEGTANTPDMRIVGCGAGTYEVLKRIDGRTSGKADAESKCSRVKDYTKWYFYDSELDSLDFVLCLRDQ